MSIHLSFSFKEEDENNMLRMIYFYFIPNLVERAEEERN